MGPGEEIKHIIAFSTVPEIGPARLRVLKEYFGSYTSAWQAKEAELRNVKLPINAFTQLIQQRDKLNVDRYVDNLDKRLIKYITILDSDYPERLKNIYDLPAVLFLRSKMSVRDFSFLISKRVIAVVGTRKMTSYGREITKQLVSELALSDVTIVSGMALGVDGVAHETCLRLGKPTVAVLGAGVDIVYPPEHRGLYQEIVEKGAVISEVAPEKLVGKGIFPARNRIVSGLSQAVLVTEGDVDSGSLITARTALDQGREVFAVPGQINSPGAKGTNFLIKQGAKMVTSAGDIFEELGYGPVRNGKDTNKHISVGETDEEQKIIDTIEREAKTIDEIVREVKLPLSIVGTIVTCLEIRGVVCSEGDKIALKNETPRTPLRFARGISPFSSSLDL